MAEATDHRELTAGATMGPTGRSIMNSVGAAGHDAKELPPDVRANDRSGDMAEERVSERAIERTGHRHRDATRTPDSRSTGEHAAGAVLHKTIVFVGMMGAGKTAVGRTLATHLGVAFRDSDHEIEEAAQRSIAEIFARDGEAFFRRKETQIIERLLDGEPGVLSTGGGAFMSEQNRRIMSEKGVSVWLNANLDLLWDRVRHKDTRPLLKTPDPKGTLRSLYEQRVPIYQLADISVMSEPGLSLEAMANRVEAALLAERPDVLESVE